MCSNGVSWFLCKKSKNGECVELLCTKHTHSFVSLQLEIRSLSFKVRIESKTTIKHSSSPIIFCRWWRDSVSPQMHEAIVKLMEKSVGVEHFTHIKLPSLEKLATLSCFIFLGSRMRKKGRRSIFLETNQWYREY